MAKIRQKTYNLGDIVFVNEYSYKNNQLGENHLFVVIGDDENLFPLEYFGLIVSSHREKSKDSSLLKYNEPLDKSEQNSLKTDSIVKCDQIYNIPKDNILFKIGSVDVDDFLRFIKAYNTYLEVMENNLFENK